MQQSAFAANERARTSFAPNVPSALHLAMKALMPRSVSLLIPAKHTPERRAPLVKSLTIPHGIPPNVSGLRRTTQDPAERWQTRKSQRYSALVNAGEPVGLSAKRKLVEAAGVEPASGKACQEKNYMLSRVPKRFRLSCKERTRTRTG